MPANMQVIIYLHIWIEMFTHRDIVEASNDKHAKRHPLNRDR
ncbi:hypothetical protein DJ61_4244 [Yersinia enterocolitica]|nr:hypothetical protein DJ61_4244 [Yersinia enterocolitica]